MTSREGVATTPASFVRARVVVPLPWHPRRVTSTTLHAAGRGDPVQGACKFVAGAVPCEGARLRASCVLACSGFCQKCFWDTTAIAITIAAAGRRHLTKLGLRQEKSRLTLFAVTATIRARGRRAFPVVAAARASSPAVATATRDVHAPGPPPLRHGERGLPARGHNQGLLASDCDRRRRW